MTAFALAARSLRRNPGFTFTALLTLALGTGASTAIFSVTNAVLLRPPPYADPARLFVIASDLLKRDARDTPFVPGDLRDLRAAATLFSGLAALSTNRQALTGDDAQPEQVAVANVTTNLFPLLGAKIVAGRDFVDDDGAPAPASGPAPRGGGAARVPEAPAPPAVVILSHEFWQRRYGGDRSILNRTVTLGASRALVAGVVEPGFELLFSPARSVQRKPDLYVALRVDWDHASRANGSLAVIGRLKDGATVGAAQAGLDAAASDLRSRFPLKESQGLHFRAEPMAADAVRAAKPAIVALMASSLFVLLIACANVASLLLVRASQREGEQAVRAALGGTRSLLARGTIAEALLLSTAGALAGLLLAWLAVRALSLVAPENVPRLDAVSMDWTVLGFTLLLVLVATCLFGVLPSLRASRPDLMAVLRPAGRVGALVSGRALARGVVVAEVTLAYALLAGCALMVRSYAALTRVDPGYEAGGLLTFSLQNARARTPQEKSAFAQAVQDRLAAIPGVQSASAAYPFPLDGNSASLRWGTDAAAADPSKFQQGNARFVRPGWFETMRTRVIEGRTFGDAENVPEAKVVVIDRVLAAKAFPDQSAVGRRLLSRFRTAEPEWFDVIGVVAHQRHETLAREGRETLYFSDGMIGYGFATHWAVRTAGDPMALASAVRAAVAAIDPLVPVAQLAPMRADVRRAQAPARLALACISAFAAIAAVLAVVGLYGTIATIVRRRTTEIGVRMAFGAPRERILTLVVRDGLLLSAAGVAIGVVLAVALARLMRSRLEGIASGDALTYAVVALAFLALAALTSWIPARRAAALDPARALRDE